MTRALVGVHYAFCALLFGLSAALIVSMSVWLEMRVHTRYIIVGFIVCGLIYSFFQREIRPFALLCGEILLFLLAMWLDKPNLIFYLIKESYLGFLSFDQVKFGFLAILSFLNILAILKFAKFKFVP